MNQLCLHTLNSYSCGSHAYQIPISSKLLNPLGSSTTAVTAPACTHSISNVQSFSYPIPADEADVRLVIASRLARRKMIGRVRYGRNHHHRHCKRATVVTSPIFLSRDHSDVLLLASFRGQWCITSQTVTTYDGSWTCASVQRMSPAQFIGVSPMNECAYHPNIVPDGTVLYAPQLAARYDEWSSVGGSSTFSVAGLAGIGKITGLGN